jgi:predicted nucleic acid-binding protein
MVTGYILDTCLI